MKNRIASLFLVFALLMSLCNFAVARDNRITVQSGGAERFTDVPADHWAYAYINKVVGSGLFNGKTATTFEPSNAMTRSQFVLVMDRMEGMKSLEGVPTQTIFPDVAPTRLAAGPIAWANEQGFVLGFGDGTFKPDSPITRGQFAALIHRYIIAKRYTNLHVVDPVPAQFTDADSVSSAFTADVEYARVHGLLTGYSDGTVRASNPITRAAIAAILARFLDLVTESGYTPLLDGPVGGGNTVDSGDSVEEPPVNVPTSYNGIRLNITNAKRGTTSFVSVLRDGVQVASDDVKPGDVVRLSHVPQDGYRATITVKDSKGKKVNVTTDGNVSTFTVPENMPVTITLKYLQTSSGGGGGGSGGGGSSGGSGGGIAPPPAASYYYLQATAVRTAASNAEGSVWLSKDPITAANVSTAPHELSINWNDVTTHGASFVFYAVLEAAADVTTTYSVSVGGIVQQNAVTGTDTSIPGYTVLTINVTSTSTAAATPTQATVMATFTRGSGTSSGDPGPGPGQTERTWTVNVTNSDEFAFYSLVEAAPSAATALTANGNATIQKTVASGTAADVYLIVTPKAGFKFGDNVIEFNPADGSTATLVSPTANSTETDAVRVYRLTRTVAQNTTTNVSINMQLVSGVGRTYDVTVNSLLWNGTTTVAMPEDVPLAASVDLNPATYLNKVTVNVPFLTGYRGYHLRGITVVGADNASVTYTKDTANSSETGDVYTFTMPNQAVTVTVVYEANANANLSYDVAVSVAGQGTVSLNIAGVTQTIDTASVTTFPVHRYVRLDDNGAVIVTEDNTTGNPMTQADYVELYGNENFTLPVYLTAAPIAAKNYKFESASYDGTAVSAANISAEQTVRNGTALNVSVSFSQITSYGYNLTVIGKGTVTNTFDNIDRTNTSGLPETFTSGLVVTNNNSLTISATPTVASGKSASDYEVMINGEVKTSDTITLTEGQLTDIIVEMHDKNRNAVEFTVQVTGGSVRVRPESGRIMSTTGYTAETAKEQLKTTTGTLASDTVNSTTKSYFAFENSVITIIPTTTDTSKVTRITVTKTPGGGVSDVLNTTGFSFQLTSPQASAVVEFGTFDSYRVLFEAPYNGGTGPSMRSLSTNIANRNYLDATVQEVLYSLNDGQRLDPATNTRTGITNEFSAPATLNQTLAYYFSHRVVEDLDGTKITGAENVKNMLEDSIKSSIATVFPSVVEAKKADLKADPTNVTGPIGTEMRSRQGSASSMEVTGAAKSSVLENTSYRQQLMDGTVQESSFQVFANVTTILSLAKENELKTQYPALANDLTGKSAEAQLSGFVSDYLGKIKVQDGYNYGNLTPNFTVTPNATNSTTPTLTISANVTATDNNWPRLDPSVSMTDYADRFNIWILVEVSQVLYDANGDGRFDPATESVTLTNVAPALYSSAQLGITVDMEAMLRNIDNAVATTWNNAFGTNGVAIDMTQVLSGELIGNVVKDFIEGPSDALTTSISSLGRGTNTRAAFMNLYDGFVECNSKDPQNMLTLKTKSGTSTVIGRATNNNQNLVLTVDFTQILRDAATPTDQTSYEVLVDLLIGLRDGISTDIRETSEASNKNQSAQSVIASLIEGQLNGRNRNAVTVNKWGTQKSGSQMTAAERKEVSNLLAGMVMNSEMDDTFTSAWKAFEESGYQSVTFSFKLDATKRGNLAPILESYYGNADTKTLDVGFNVTQVIN